MAHVVLILIAAQLAILYMDKSETASLYRETLRSIVDEENNAIINEVALDDNGKRGPVSF